MENKIRYHRGKNKIVKTSNFVKGDISRNGLRKGHFLSGNGKCIALGACQSGRLIPCVAPYSGTRSGHAVRGPWEAPRHRLPGGWAAEMCRISIASLSLSQPAAKRRKRTRREQPSTVLIAMNHTASKMRFVFNLRSSS